MSTSVRIAAKNATNLAGFGLKLGTSIPFLVQYLPSILVSTNLLCLLLRASSCLTTIQAPWGASLGLIGGWLVYPTLTSEFKENFGMGEAPPSGVSVGSSVKYAKEGIGQTPEVAS